MPGNIFKHKFGPNLNMATNELVIRIQPRESIYLKINNKVGIGGARAAHDTRPSPACWPVCSACPCSPARPPSSQVPGLGMRLDTTKLDLVYKDEYSKELPDAYERLLLDVVNGERHHARGTVGLRALLQWCKRGARLGMPVTLVLGARR